MQTDFDIIVLGGGAGGGTLAATCAAAGKSVLLVDRGGYASPQSMTTNGHAHDEQSTLIDKTPYDDRSVELNGAMARLYMGGILGGGTALYGGALMRPKPEDFSPGKYYGERIQREISNWPITYESLAPFLRVAERLYRVTDTEDASSPSSIAPAESSVSCEPSFSGLPLARINERLMQATRESGMNPYRLPLAIDTSKCLKCDHCAGFPCPTGARRSSAQLIMESIERNDPLTLKLNCEADRFERGENGRTKGIWVRNRVDQSTTMFRAKRYVLAAGAIGSAALLLKSGFDHPLIGRNYMMHYSPLAIGIFARRTEASRTFVKQVGFSDCYFGTTDLPQKMGIIQSLPAPGPLMMAKSGLRFVPKAILNTLRARMLPLVGIVEDLPNPDNRVSINSSGTIRLLHEYSDFDRERGAALGRHMTRLLKSAGALHCVSSKIPSREHVAHQCGTLRFGTSGNHAVADPECRLFDQSDVFIADGSFMPTSLGVGPSLTIIANAVRVAEIVTSEV